VADQAGECESLSVQVNNKTSRPNTISLNALFNPINSSTKSHEI
jgi:hypothetical protein